MCNLLEAWKLPEINVYPTNMINFRSRDQKRTLIIVSGSEQLFSLAIEDLNETLRGNSAQFPFAKCDVDNQSASICVLKSAGSKTAVVTTEGKLLLYDCEDTELICINSLANIRHIDWGSETNQLLVVRQPEGARTILEVLDFADGRSAGVPVKNYELVADCIDSGAKYCIRTLTINEANRQFWGDFLGFSKLSSGEEVIMIAINNQLHWLQPGVVDDCDLITVRCFASNVVAFDFSENSICLTVLLEPGVLVVFNQSVHPDTLVVSSSFIYLQAPIEAHGFDKANNSFLYSNGLTTHRVRYHFSEETKQLVTESEEIPVHGVVAITLIEDKELALLLTENKKFYAIACSGRYRDIVNQSSTVVTLRKEMRAVAKRATKILTDEVEFDRRLDQAIQSTQAHFNVLALYRNKNVFGNLSRMETTFHLEMPTSKANTVLLRNHGNQEPCLFASLKIEINLGLFELLKKQRRWTVCIEYDAKVVTYPVHDTFDTLGVLLATVFLCQSQLVDGLPMFRANLLASVRSGNNNLLLTIPVATCTLDMLDAGSLIRKMEPASNADWHYNTKHLACQQLVSQSNPHPMKGIENRNLTYCIRNEQSKTKAVSFSSVLENEPGDSWFVFATQVNVRWHSGKDALFLKTRHPVALDLAKRFLLLNEEYKAEMEQRMDKLKGICLELQAVSCADLIVQLYHRVRYNGQFIADSQ